MVEAGQAFSRRKILRRAVSAEVFVGQERHRCMVGARQIDQAKCIVAFNIAVSEPFRIGEGGGGHRRWFRHPMRRRQLPLAGGLREN